MLNGSTQDKKPSILVIDDEQFMLDTFRETLEESGFMVVTAADGGSAITAFRESVPDLVLLDLVMPGIDGFATCQKLRSLPGGAYIPILMVTALDDRQSINHAFEAGATDFITKPVNTELLAFRVRYMLRSSRSIKWLESSEARLAEAQRVAHLGTWEWEPSTGDFQGSEETFRILGLEKSSAPCTYTSLFIAIFPPDREMVDSHLRNASVYRTACSFQCRIGPPDAPPRLVYMQAWMEPAEYSRSPRLLGTIHDITELKQAEDRLLLLKEAIDSLPIGITISDIDGKIIYLNHSEARMHGYAADELVGRDANIFAPAQLHTLLPNEAIRSDEVWQRESINIRQDGTPFPVQLSSIAVRNADGAFLGIVTACEDISSRKEAEIRIHHLAYFDALTGLPNRGAFLDRLNQAVSLARRQSRRIGLIFLDLDNFKDVNDSQGHDFGDRLLRLVAIRLATVMRESDTLARLGGDEFVVVLSSLDDQESAGAAAQRILSSLARPFEIDGIQVGTSASIGIAIYPDNGNDAETLYKCADTAMYHAKSEARSHYRFFSADLNRQAMHRMALENGLRHGLEINQFEMHYHPQWDLKSGKLAGVEALLRWKSPEFGLRLPDEFIPVAERSGLIFPLGEWAIKTSFVQAGQWHMNGHAGLKVAVNISGRQLRQQDFLEMVKRLIGETGVNPECIEFEFTESVIMDKADWTINILRSLKEMGMTLAIDDFGTGYSSLSYLKHFPIDRIKIDRSFVADIDCSSDDAAIVEAVISLAHSLKLKVMAEGVENAGQMKFLMTHGCDEVQGFHLARPMTAGDVTELLKTLKRQDGGEENPRDLFGKPSAALDG
jgi:diguanylate cyclase (GGDEF)-like protein/PAS domain S-box-containing protein